MRRSLAIAGLLIGLTALLLQFAITVPAAMTAGRSLFLSIVFYFSFFTILTNIALVLVYAGALSGASWLAVFRHPATRAGAAAAIALVSSFYHIVLAPLWQPEGLLLVCDIALHYVTPILYILWFVGFNRSGTLTLRAVPIILAPPVAYLVYVMLRGAILGEYPYPVFEADRIGYGQVALNALVLLIVLAVLAAIAIAIDRFRPHNDKPHG